jgi:hypothetical protein
MFSHDKYTRFRTFVLQVRAKALRKRRLAAKQRIGYNSRR